MSVFGMSDEEKSKIREQHNKATKEYFDKIAETKKGLQGLKPVEKKEEKKEEKK
jgi:hypothetical protein